MGTVVFGGFGAFLIGFDAGSFAGSLTLIASLCGLMYGEGVGDVTSGF